MGDERIKAALKALTFSCTLRDNAEGVGTG